MCGADLMDLHLQHLVLNVIHTVKLKPCQTHKVGPESQKDKEPVNPGMLTSSSSSSSSSSHSSRDSVNLADSSSTLAPRCVPENRDVTTCCAAVSHKVALSHDQM
ncbi:unnamed protein product [Pleuronectes platessa]|uniref:Uncharacterized protein n=1 Tax=Pleuronectes platessa TaxID=8262 RepID=A0A9N7V7I1_PLEPL|nr:unnamed protein product [Pleuronectes platessa]